LWLFSVFVRMPSRALRNWQVRGRKVLDEVEAAHAVVGGGRGARAFARQQINQAYVVLLSSQFQRFCRDLYDESADHLISRPEHAPLNPILRGLLIRGRRLDRGNANPGNIGADFERLGVSFWNAVRAQSARNPVRQRRLEELNTWRNAIAHHDFRDPALQGGSRVSLAQVRRWRSACNALAVEFDRVMELYLCSFFGVAPW
jgi:hypothetical protein